MTIQFFKIVQVIKMLEFEDILSFNLKMRALLCVP